MHKNAQDRRTYNVSHTSRHKSQQLNFLRWQFIVKIKSTIQVLNGYCILHIVAIVL